MAENNTDGIKSGNPVLSCFAKMVSYTRIYWYTCTSKKHWQISAVKVDHQTANFSIYMYMWCIWVLSP